MTLHVFHFTASINPVTTSILQDLVLRAVTSGKASKLQIHISTDGGSTSHGFALYNFLRSLPVPVTTVNMGSVESMGVVLYLAGAVRIAAPHSRFLLHPLNWNFNEGRVDHARLTEHSLCLDNDFDRYSSIFTERTSDAAQPIDIQSCLKNNAKVLTPEDAIAAGLSHETKAVELPSDAVSWWVNSH
ncbi:ATP-dependent Clp protease proteolytic subunit [uncultured Pseudomonas sp.]|uniref:ATP-dependent Clp protease proteolytic subunit n=1 Tax=uncultured Pseudomonas sp. TaxID=114707 RepID=UPI00258A6561|nr:ATP-dependent Clp protease proteolytic subunit [uncultured Pseudomonas sp.]